MKRDQKLLFATRFVRLFSYGLLSVVLVLYLTSLGLSSSETGTLLTLTLLGDTVASLVLTTQADRWGRKRVLLVGAFLMVGAGLAFALTRNWLSLVIAGTIGVISPSGNEVGPFLPVEQAALSEVVPASARTNVFAWYTLIGSLATAVGSLCAGLLAQRSILFVYAGFGLVLAVLFGLLTPAAEVKERSETRSLLGVVHSRGVVAKLSGLFSLDAFAGGFVVQSFVAYWFSTRFHVEPAALGGIFFGANVLAGISALLATRIANRIGLVQTMVFTHLPSNVLLMLVPLMPTAGLATVMLFLRFSISQMDVPTRQSYTMSVVRPEERSAAAGITGVARTTGAAIAPLFAGILYGDPTLRNLPFYLAGGLKIAYDLLLFRAFVKREDAER